MAQKIETQDARFTQSDVDAAVFAAVSRLLTSMHVADVPTLETETKRDADMRARNAAGGSYVNLTSALSYDAAGKNARSRVQGLRADGRIVSATVHGVPHPTAPGWVLFAHVAPAAIAPLK